MCEVCVAAKRVKRTNELHTLFRNEVYLCLSAASKVCNRHLTCYVVLCAGIFRVCDGRKLDFYFSVLSY